MERRRNNNRVYTDTNQRPRGQGFLTSRTPEDEARVEEEAADDTAGDEAGLAANGSCLSAVASDSFECRACSAGFARVEGEADFVELRAEEKDRDFGSGAIWRVVEVGLEEAVCLKLELAVGSEYRRPRDDDEDDVSASRCGCSIELRGRFFRSASVDLGTGTFEIFQPACSSSLLLFDSLSSLTRTISPLARSHSRFSHAASSLPGLGVLRSSIRARSPSPNRLLTSSAFASLSSRTRFFSRKEARRAYDAAYGSDQCESFFSKRAARRSDSDSARAFWVTSFSRDANGSGGVSLFETELSGNKIWSQLSWEA